MNMRCNILWHVTPSEQQTFRILTINVTNKQGHRAEAKLILLLKMPQNLPAIFFLTDQ